MRSAAMHADCVILVCLRHAPNNELSKIVSTMQRWNKSAIRNAISLLNYNDMLPATTVIKARRIDLRKIHVEQTQKNEAKILA